MVNTFDESHYLDLCRWWESHGMPIVPMDHLSTHGRVVDNIAAGFLIATDTPLAILDFFITNPESSKEDRDKALDELTQTLIKDAKVLGYDVLMASSKISAVVERAKKNGFKSIGVHESLILGGD